MNSTIILFGALGLIFLAFALFVWGFVPEEIEEDEIYGYRLTRRKRMLEEDALYALVLPLVKLFAHYIRSLPNLPFVNMEELRSSLRDKLMRSGFMGSFTPNEFLGMCCVSGLGGFVFVLLFTQLMTGLPNVGLACVAGFLALGFPWLSLSGAISSRLIEIDRRLPYTVDLLVLSMRAGLDFMSALDRVVARGQIQNPDDPMIQELGVVLQEMRVGTARTDALINLCERVNSEYLNSMVGAIIQSERRGTPLANVLEIQVDTIRNKRTAKIEKAASQAAVKILFPLLFIFGAVMIVIMGAMIIKVSGTGF
ncbi:type II secretion system F family protein [Lujinxingia vulgaris]|uniref:Type II secretion system F family protein n=1 Tax=Lujinxingia vulgaris TaxID=2600176 RepID=A0A5C6XHH8_9DELT|nr:type II secretion system F family protein [Lujinxingia vulgaris]TXD38958.1 type II secretion system F family protein [Lujinxingia vulgaris]